MKLRADRPTILIVDDMPENLDILKSVLGADFRIKVALTGEKALQIARSEQAPKLILLDVVMPGMSGYDVCRELKQDLATKHIPVIFVTARDNSQDEMHGFNLGAVDYITKPFSPGIVLTRINTHLALSDQKAALESIVRERTQALHRSRLEIIRRLGRASEFKDNETGLHVIRMSHYSRLLALAAKLSPEEADLLLEASPMHDVGKIGIPDRILKKPGPLSEEEMDTMRQHSQFGAEIIGEHNSDVLKMACTIALTHHEKWDGSGYPKGLKGEEIPLIGRIVAIADVFDALASERPYKKAWSIERTQEYMRKQSGRHFDPELIELFFQIMPDILAIRSKHLDENQDETKRL